MRLILLLAALLALPGPLHAADPTPQQLQDLSGLLRDPAMQDWLRRQGGAVTDQGGAGDATVTDETTVTDEISTSLSPTASSPTVTEAVPGAGPPAAVGPAADAASAEIAPIDSASAESVPAETASVDAETEPAQPEAAQVTPASRSFPADTDQAAAESGTVAPPTMQANVGDRLARTRQFLRSVAAAAPNVPAELGIAGQRFKAEAGDQGLVRVLSLVFAFIAIGIGVEWLFRLVTTPIRKRVSSLQMDTLEQRLRAAWARTAYGLLLLLAFAVGSVGTFLLFPWPPLLTEIVLGYLSVILLVRLVLVFGRIVLAPGVARFRMVPMATPSARFWFVWSAVLVGWFRFVQTTLDVLRSLAVPQPVVALIGLVLGLILVGLTLYVVWRHPDADGTAPIGRSKSLSTWLLSLYLIAIWTLLLTGSVAPFYIGVVLLLLPIALRGVRLAVRHLVRPPDASGSQLAVDAPPPPLAAVIVERLLRAVLLIAAAYFVAYEFGIDFNEMTSRDTLAARLMRGAVNAFSILLLADLAWQVARAWIDRRLVRANSAGAPVPSEGDHGVVMTADVRREARMRTLLPMLRNVLMIVFVVVAVLMALASIGIDVAPLIAGAGVVGLAVGFGAQTLVKDLISGVFFLIDDAFRVGEYIESGKIRGTVEAFSLRSIKLRHHRGALHTIPFGSIEMVTNYSRDWAIDKISINVTYDTDLEKAKKLIKEIGRQLFAHPELGPHMIEPLKMQGVEMFGDYAIQIRLKMMTQPGEQFVIRRRAYAMIKKAFNENGIEFAYPTVKVSGGDVNAAASHAAIEHSKPPAEAVGA